MLETQKKLSEIFLQRRGKAAPLHESTTLEKKKQKK